MSQRSTTSRLRVEQLEDRTTPSGSQIPAGEFNWMQYSPNGTLGQLIWNGQTLVYRTRSGNAWQSETIARSDDFTELQYNTRDEVQTASQTAQLVYTTNGNAHALYLEELFHWQTNTFQTVIRHYARGANGWRMVETIAPPWRTTWGPNNLVAEAGLNNSIHLIFSETQTAATAVGNFGTGRLTYATNKTGTWTFDKIANTADLNYDVWIMGMRYTPRFLSLAVDAQNNAHVTYTPKFFISGAFGTVKSELRYATNAGGAWLDNRGPVDRRRADAGLGASVAVAPNGTVAVASYYVDRYVTGSPEKSWLMHSTRGATGTWNTVTAVGSPDGYVGEDGPDFTGFAPHLSFDSQSRPTVVFSDEGSDHLPVSYANELAGQIRSTTLTNGSWVTTTLYRQTNPLTFQLFYPVAATFNGQTAYAGLVAASALDANNNPLRLDVSLVDVNVPGGSTSPPTVPPPPPSPPPPSPPPPPPPPVKPVLASATEAGSMTIVRVDYSNGSYYWWTPFGSFFTGGATVALADVNKDGIDDIIVASGPGIPALVRVWNGKTRALLADYTPLGGFAGGLNVAAGDVNGDGAADIVVGVKQGGASVVTVISGLSGQRLGQFHAYWPGYQGGIQLGVGDVNHDGRADVVVAPGTAGLAARMKVFDGRSIAPGLLPTDLVTPFFAFTSAYTGAINVTVGDITGDGYADIVVGNGAGIARFRIYSGADVTAGQTTTPLVTQVAWPSETRGVRVSLVDDTDGDGRLELILVAPGQRLAVRLLSSQFTATGWSSGVFDWFEPMPGIQSGIYVG